jgi:hypothetical protein
MRSPFLRSFLSSAALASVLLCVGAARADDAVGNDEVMLKNGGSVRGTVVSSDPGQSVTILELGEKGPRVIPWDQVSGVERGKFAPPPAAAAPPGGPQAPALVPGTPGVVRLHVQSPVPVEIYKHRDSYGETSRGNTIVLDTPRPVCASPCDVLVDGSRGREFSAAGEDAVESPRFSLAGLAGDQELDVSPGSPGLRAGGYLLLALAGIGVGAGTIVAFAGAVGTSPNPHGPGFIRNKGLETAGFVMLGTGVAAAVGAIVALAESGTTIRLRPGGASGEAKPRYWAGEF